MSGDIFRFTEFCGSGRGLIAGPILPNNQIAKKSDISVISYEVKNITDNTPSVTGSLDVDDVMFDTPQPWDYDKRGYTFLWRAPGTLWPLPKKSYRVKVTFTTVPALGSISFFLVWQVDTIDPIN